ncbi:NAD(P)/FAD-dependent oxidoreductase [Rhodohalobacter mucosus]|uniref:Aminoacetone oxidase family FAD-binding enzyme n=1 Tax=Rhodohalobacter mucosus TaxID=2079485 RepID=A0A316TQH0_9BACT|nr:NAD(P)/FAD-dependent oxidoreductase [Rhodohalobacter mucosus]PWN05479.1 aminoacetone oxidase family FAD-binding enzyme [Rhodohalobacter mucosus]
MNKPAVAVIGGGAAGFFTAVNAARLNPGLRVTIFEKSKNVLSKVRISGGGRCNVTHHCFDPEQLSAHYPRGAAMLRWSFEQFQARDTAAWFESRGVALKTEPDGRMFPVSDSSESVISCLMHEARIHGVKIRNKTRVDRISPLSDSGFSLSINKKEAEYFDAVVVATGGYNREKAYEWLKELGHTIRTPVPSLFTFNFREKVFSDLAGISVNQAEVHIEGTRFTESGPLLITHWGLSGPAVLKLSAWAARELHEKEYRYTVRVNWLAPMNELQVREKLLDLRERNARKKVVRQDLLPLPARLWERQIQLSGIDDRKRWAELSNKEVHELVQNLVNARYDIQGKTTYKEEFVTCGGIRLKEVNPDTLESKKVPGLYFVGEVLDIDGVTGGFNFQAAWTNGWLAAKALAEKYQTGK